MMFISGRMSFEKWQRVCKIDLDLQVVGQMLCKTKFTNVKNKKVTPALE